jgi:hypothetical protein
MMLAHDHLPHRLADTIYGITQASKVCPFFKKKAPSGIFSFMVFTRGEK